MLDIKKDLNKIKDYLYESHLEVTMNSDFDALMKLKSVNEDLRETLILLHSHHKAEFQAIKNHNFRILLNVIDIQSEAFEKVINKQIEMSNLIENSLKSSKDKKISIGRILILLTAIGSFIVVMFFLFTSDKEAGKMVIDLVKSMVPRIL